MNEGLHVGIIMDGNRRFAKRLMKEPWKGHEYGAQKLEELLSWCEEAGIREATIYALSIQNLNRPKHELDFLLDLFRKELKNWGEESAIMTKRLKVNHIGRKDLLPEDIAKSLVKLEEKTSAHDNFIVNLCIAYGGQEEIVEAVHKIANDVKEGKVNPLEVDIDLINNYVYLKDQPDLIIRTGGDIRTSNFLVWQSAYSEWFFVDKLWPEFDKETFLSCIDEFKSRDRRFGK